MTSKWVPTTNLAMLRRMGKLGEELGELQAVAARCIIQGIDEIDPASGKTNRQRLTEELADVQAQIGCTVLALRLDQEAMAQRTARKVGYMREWEAMFGDADPVPCGPWPPIDDGAA
jgi:NTP pyrophosphatase (non-canonical NTP hydrolase)